MRLDSELVQNVMSCFLSSSKTEECKENSPNYGWRHTEHPALLYNTQARHLDQVGFLCRPTKVLLPLCVEIKGTVFKEMCVPLGHTFFFSWLPTSSCKEKVSRPTS